MRRVFIVMFLLSLLVIKGYTMTVQSNQTCVNDAVKFLNHEPTVTDKVFAYYINESGQLCRLEIIEDKENKNASSSFGEGKLISKCSNNLVKDYVDGDGRYDGYTCTLYNNNTVTCSSGHPQLETSVSTNERFPIPATAVDSNNDRACFAHGTKKDILYCAGRNFDDDIPYYYEFDPIIEYYTTGYPIVDVKLSNYRLYLLQDIGNTDGTYQLFYYGDNSHGYLGSNIKDFYVLGDTVVYLRNSNGTTTFDYPIGVAYNTQEYYYRQYDRYQTNLIKCYLDSNQIPSIIADGIVRTGPNYTAIYYDRNAHAFYGFKRKLEKVYATDYYDKCTIYGDTQPFLTVPADEDIIDFIALDEGYRQYYEDGSSKFINFDGLCYINNRHEIYCSKAEYDYTQGKTIYKPFVRIP